MADSEMVRIDNRVLLVKISGGWIATRHEKEPCFAMFGSTTEEARSKAASALVYWRRFLRSAALDPHPPADGRGHDDVGGE